jgi:type IV secretory pathway VirB6-like protein
MSFYLPISDRTIHSLKWLALVLAITAVVQAVLWKMAGPYQNLAFPLTLYFSFVVAFIWDAPGYIIFIIMFLILIHWLKKRNLYSVGWIITSTLMTDLVIGWLLDLDDFKSIFNLPRLTWQDVVLIQIGLYFRFGTMLVFSLIYGLGYYFKIDPPKEGPT